MKEIINLIRNDRILSRFYFTSFGLIFITISYIVFVYRNLPPLIPLYNQLPWGSERLGSRIEIFIPDLVVVFISILNLIISTVVYKNSPLISRMLSVTSFLIALLTFLFIFRTTQIVL